MRNFAIRRGGCFQPAVIVALAWLVLAMPAGAQKKDKNKKNDTPDANSQAALIPLPTPPDSQAIDQTIAEMMGYWQIGDVESMRKYFDPGVVVISGAWEPPVMGWDNYVRAYQAQRARVSGGRMDRSNTFIKVNGNTAWATYQFVYVTSLENKMMEYRGHTTLILNKQADRWVITLNHSSVVDSSAPAAASLAEPAQPSKP
jgi:hypothetical protein